MRRTVVDMYFHDARSVGAAGRPEDLRRKLSTHAHDIGAD
jgi:hypothetical protein